MNKADLLTWLQNENAQWQALLATIGPARMEQPGVNGVWSMKELIAHLTGWERALVARIEAAQRHQPEPSTPWPAQLQSDDEINAWIEESNRGRMLDEILAEAQQTHQQLVATLEALPDDVRIEVINPAFHLVWIDDQNFLIGEFFHHFHDDHEENVRAWLSDF